MTYATIAIQTIFEAFGHVLIWAEDPPIQVTIPSVSCYIQPAVLRTDFEIWIANDIVKPQVVGICQWNMPPLATRGIHKQVFAMY